MHIPFMEEETPTSNKQPEAVATSLSPSSSSSLDASSLATTSSSASSLAASLSLSSLDSTLLSRYTSCPLLNLPVKLLACSPPLESPPLSLTLLDGLVVAGTQAHGLVGLETTKDLCRIAAFDAANSGGAIKALLFLSDQNQLISADQTGRIRIWQQRRSRQSNWEVAATLPTTIDVLWSAVLPGNYIRLRRHRWQLWLRHADAVSSLAAAVTTAGEELLVSASWDRSIKVWKSRRCIASLASAHDDAVNAIVGAERFLYTGGADGKVKAWELVESKSRTTAVTLVATLEAHKAGVNALALDEAGFLYSGGADKVIVVWEREEAASHMSKVDVLKGHRMPVLCLAISSSRSAQYSVLCSGSADKTIRVWKRDWSTATHQCLAVVCKAHQEPVKALAIRRDEPEGVQILSAGLDSRVKSWWLSLLDEQQL